MTMFVLSQENELSGDLLLLDVEDGELEFPPDDELQKGFLLDEVD